LKKTAYRRHRFPQKYSPFEVQLLARTDELRGWLSGSATKSRPRQSNDNGLVETKNDSVVRKQLGYAYIPQRCAELINEFNRDYSNPYINFHRPCFFSVSVIDHKGKIKKTYPYEKLKSLPEAGSYLCPGVTFEVLETIANQMSYNKFAERMVKAHSNLFEQITKFANRVA
jgi:hypothetical protein